MKTYPWIDGVIADLVDFAVQHDLPEVADILLRASNDLGPYIGAVRKALPQTTAPIASDCDNIINVAFPLTSKRAKG